MILMTAIMVMTTDAGPPHVAAAAQHAQDQKAEQGCRHWPHLPDLTCLPLDAAVDKHKPAD